MIAASRILLQLMPLACIVWLTPSVFPQVQRLEGALAAGASASVEGTIQNVTYKDEKSGYTVLKVAALHTAGAPPEQRRSAAQRQSRPINGTLSSPWHPIRDNLQATSPSASSHSFPPGITAPHWQASSTGAQTSAPCSVDAPLEASVT